MWDNLVIGIYLIIIFSMAFWTGRKRSYRPEDYYLANRKITLFQSLFSIIATEVSALTFLGLPAYAFKKDISFLQIYIGAFFGRIVIAKLFLPAIYGKGVTVYGIIAGNNNPSARRIMSGVFSITKILAVGVRLFSGSIMVAEFLNLSMPMALFLVTALTTIYTSIGGLSAVVKTDSMQMFLFIIGGIAAHFIIPDLANLHLSGLWSIAHSAGKFQLFDMNNPSAFFIGVAGGFLFDMATHGVDQDLVQRLLATNNLKKAQLSIFLSSFLSILIGLLFLSVGNLLWSYYQIVPPPQDIVPDRLFAHVIISHFPPGLKGLMVAGALAATMSTLDSTINALGSCLRLDIIGMNPDESLEGKTIKDTIILSSLLFLVALWAGTSESLLILGLKIASWTGGPLLSLFILKILLGKFKKSMPPVQIAFHYILGILFVAVNVFIIKGPWPLNIYYGTLGSCLSLLIYRTGID